MPSAGKICKSHLEAAGSCDKDAEQGPRAGQGLPPSYQTRLGHSGVGSLKSHFPGALESRSVEWSVMSRVKSFCYFQILCGEGPHKGSQSSWKVPLLSLPRLCHILGVTFWVFLVKLLSQDPPLRLSTLLNTPSMVGYALGRIPWLQDVALIA